MSYHLLIVHLILCILTLGIAQAEYGGIEVQMDEDSSDLEVPGAHYGELQHGEFKPLTVPMFIAVFRTNASD